jgi:type IX secretion system PorP/SprF family membrane protein
MMIIPFLGIGQQFPYFSLTQYQLNRINPAYVGIEGGSVFTLGSRMQWSGIEGSPTSYTLGYSSSRSERVGLGFSMVSDKVFIEQQTMAYVDFSYQLPITEKIKVYLGLKGGGNFYKSDPSGLQNYLGVADPSKTPVRQFSPNIGVGVYVVAGSSWISISAPRLVEVTRGDKSIVYAKDRVHSYAAAGTKIKVNEQFSLLPSVLFRKVAGLPLSTEVSTQLQFNQGIEIGAQVRDVSNMSLFGMFRIRENISVGYAYESFADTEISGLKENAHELLLRITLGGANSEQDKSPETELDADDL